MDLTASDRAALVAAGRAPDEIEHQLSVLRGPAPRTRLERPCTVGDGIIRLDPAPPEIESLWAEARDTGRITSFIPASGAASRLLADLILLRTRGVTHFDALRQRVAAGEKDLAPGLKLLEHLRELALWDVLGLPDTAEVGEILSALLGRYEGQPKALLPFHRASEGVRTSFCEQLVEAAIMTASAAGDVGIHFTVSPEHRADFDEHLAALQPGLQARLGVRFSVSWSVQDPATDTVAIEADGSPVREGGALVFRPGGHGALLRNLEAQGGDLVLIKNIDNVVPDHLRAEPLRWRRRLVGMAVQVQRTIHALIRALDAGQDVTEYATGLLENLLHQPVPDPRAVRALLDRPLRVCGMVPNRGLVGGGPYFVSGPDGRETPQIVEGVQVDQSDPAQKAIFLASTHFNPVELVCALRDPDGRPYPLQTRVDQRAAMVSAKQYQGRPIRILEHPGLWNGSMAGWNTVFIEVPAILFNPVKSVADLLLPEHR